MAWVIFGHLCYFMLIYTLSKPINLWWYRRYPPRLDPELLKVIQHFFPYYKQLNDEEKLRFEQRVNLFNVDMEFLTKEFEEVPPDVMVLISSTAIQLTFGLYDFMMEDWEKVVLYRQAFHTPRFQYFHTGEIHAEDGVIILAADPVIKGIVKPSEGYDMSLHQMAMAWATSRYKKGQAAFMPLQKAVTELGYPKLLAKLSIIRGWQHRFKSDYLAFAQEDLFGVCVEHFFKAPANFKKEMPDLYKGLTELLNQDPLNAGRPVIRRTKVTEFAKE